MLQSDEPEREIRFATVIYGGVSLAIYINGIVQEMLHLTTGVDVIRQSMRVALRLEPEVAS